MNLNLPHTSVGHESAATYLPSAALLPLAVPDEVAALVRAWRARAMSVVTWALVVISFVPFVMIVLYDALALPWPVRALATVSYLLLPLAAWRRDWSLEWRAVLLFGPAFAITALQFWTTGLLGSGRNALLLLPILALILVGNRAGWLTAGLSLLMFGAVSGLAGSGRLAQSLSLHENTTALSFWLLQGVLWLAALIPLMVLLSRFQSLQMKGLVEERRARHEVEAAAVERRRLEEEITRVSEEEQRRIGSELHDGLCQQLTAALLKCTAIGNDLTARGTPEGAAVRQLGGLLEACIGSAYDAAKGLCPVDLDPESLVPALRRLARRLQAESGITCALRAAGDAPALRAEAVHHLYRIAQEATVNAVKHARCRRIDLEFNAALDHCTLRVADDGQAPPGVEEPSRPGGMGARIMGYRAKAIGGELRIERPVEGGTVVICRVPCGVAFEAAPARD